MTGYALDGTGLAPTQAGAPATLPDVVAVPRSPRALRAASALRTRLRQATAWPLALLVLGDLFAVALVLPQFTHRGSAVAVALAPVAFRALGLNRQRLALSWLTDLPRLVAGALLPFAAVALFAPAQTGSPRDPALGVAALLVGRGVTTTVLRRARKSGLWEQRALVVGAGEVGQQLAAQLLAHPEHGVKPVGFLDDEAFPGGTTHLPVLGRPSDLVTIAKAMKATTVIVAFGRCRDPELVPLLRAAEALRGTVMYVPRMYELGVAADPADEVWGIPLVRLRRSGSQSPALRAKRDLDVVGAFFGLLVALPVLLPVLPLLRRETGASLLFRQQRIGRDGRPFTLYKLRTLAPEDPTESDTKWSIAGDPRVGPIGKVLRATSLDELPQLWNVLRGDMSLVGPRPERPFFVEEFSATHRGYSDRVRMPVGLTGWAQVNGLRGATSISDRARFDNAYIERWSLWLDLKICLRTVAQVFRRGGA